MDLEEKNKSTTKIICIDCQILVTLIGQHLLCLNMLTWNHITTIITINISYIDKFMLFWKVFVSLTSIRHVNCHSSFFFSFFACE